MLWEKISITVTITFLISLLLIRSKWSCEEISAGANSVLDIFTLSLLTVRQLCAILVLIELTIIIILKLIMFMCLWVVLQQHISSMLFTNVSQMLVTCNNVLKDVLKQVRLLYKDLKDVSSETNMHASAQILSSLLSISDRHTGAVKILIDWVVVRDPITRAQINLLINTVC